MQLDGNVTITDSIIAESACETSSTSTFVSSVESFSMYKDSDSCLSTSFEESYELEEEKAIPVITNHIKSEDARPPPWYDGYCQYYEPRPPIRKTIRRDNRLFKSTSLSIIAVSNCRSLIPKVRKLAQYVHNRDIGLSLLI